MKFGTVAEIVRRYPKLQSYDGAQKRKLFILSHRINKGIDSPLDLVIIGVLTRSDIEIMCQQKLIK